MTRAPKARTACAPSLAKGCGALVARRRARPRVLTSRGRTVAFAAALALLALYFWSHA